MSDSIWDNFDANNMTDEQRNLLLADMYGGYKEKQGHEIYVERGAGDGRGKVPTGRYQTSTNYDFYKNHPGWSGVADAADISSINNLTDLGQMADYVSHYGKNNNNEMPEDENISEEPASNTPVQLSNRSAQANAGTSAYEQVLLNQQGSSTIGGSKKPEQAFKNAYQSNLTNELKSKAPGALADKINDIQQSDVQSALVNDDYSLNLAKSGMQPGQAGKRGLEFV